MDERDVAILKTVQKEFPLARRPFDELSRRLGIPADEIHRRISALRAAGVIRRLGPLFSTRKLGFRGHLVAAQVEPDAVDAVARMLEGHDEITHNYLRSGRFNVWFTVMLPEGDDPAAIIDEVERSPGVACVESFRTERIFKLDASFDFGDNDDG